MSRDREFREPSHTPQRRRAALERLTGLALWGVVGTLCTLLGCRTTQEEQDTALTLFGAASTTDVMRDLAQRWELRTGTKVRTSFASSATLARQIEAGAPADLFISANEEWMTHLEAKGRLQEGTRSNLLSNRLVLIAPASRGFAWPMHAGADLASAFEGKLALADPAHAPAGKYAMQALEKLGWWGPLQARVLPAKDVRAAVAAVESGGAGAGVVYATDAATSPRVKVVGVFPETTHAPIRYPIAMLRGAQRGTRELMQFLRGEEARAVYREAGFSVVDAPQR